MKAVALTFALLLGGAAFAQSDSTIDATAYDGDGVTTTAYETDTVATASAEGSAGGSLVQPSNSSPERDARGIAVISDPAVVPAGWNGTAAGSAMGGPEVDPATGQPAAPETYPACTATVTDNCLQTYERGRKD